MKSKDSDKNRLKSEEVKQLREKFKEIVVTDSAKQNQQGKNMPQATSAQAQTSQSVQNQQINNSQNPAATQNTSQQNALSSASPKTQNTNINQVQNQAQGSAYPSQTTPSYKMTDPESVMENERVTNLVMQQIKELIQIDNNLNTKLKEIETKVGRASSSFTDIKNTVDRFNERLDFIEKNLEKFMGLYEVVTNIFNPFTIESNKNGAAQNNDTTINGNGITRAGTSSSPASTVIGSSELKSGNGSSKSSVSSSSHTLSASSSSVNSTGSNITSGSGAASQQQNNQQPTQKSSASNAQTSTSSATNTSVSKENPASQTPQTDSVSAKPAGLQSSQPPVAGKEQAQNRFAELKRQKELAASAEKTTSTTAKNPSSNSAQPNSTITVPDNSGINHSANINIVNPGNTGNSNPLANSAPAATNTITAMANSPLNIEISPSLKNSSGSGLIIVDNSSMPISPDSKMYQSSQILNNDRSESDSVDNFSSEVSAANLNALEPSSLTDSSNSCQQFLPALYAKEVSPEYHFSIAGGMDIKSITDLICALKEMDDKTFTYYVNSDSNDFAEWIRLVSENNEAADLLSQLNERSELILALECMIAEGAETNIEKGVQ
jgi:trimeric autotransporter adhesin